MAELGPSLVYSLCLAASALCAFLLLHTWRKTRSRLLFWTAAGFVALAVNNLILVADMVLFLASDAARKVTGELVSVSGNAEWEE